MVGNVIDGNSVYGDESVLRSLSKGSSEIEDVFNSGWFGKVVINGSSAREPIWCLNMEMETAAFCVLWD